MDKVINYFYRRQSDVFVVLLHASTAFDRVHHLNLNICLKRCVSNAFKIDFPHLLTPVNACSMYRL